MKYCHGDSLEVICDEFDMDEWYIGMSNHLSADIFVILVSANYRIPLTKFFMKRVMVDTIYFLATNFKYAICLQTLKKSNEKNPELRNKDYETTLHACKDFYDLHQLYLAMLKELIY